jgi:CRP-like cAMP-binding protein
MVRSMSDAIIGELLRRLPIFADLSPAELAEVVKVARPMPKRKGARIFEEGSPPDCCLVLTAGRAKVVLSGARESEVTVGVLEPFSVVGEIGLLDASSRRWRNWRGSMARNRGATSCSGRSRRIRNWRT